MFVLIGLVPHTAWLDGQIPLDEKGLATEDVSEQRLRYR
jgi:alkyl hydroperoxide reductase subunit AhpF